MEEMKENKNRARDENKKMTYKEKFIQMNREAKATWILAAAVIVFWWIGGFGLYHFAGADLRIAHIPAWVIVSCFGSWIISIAGVVFLVKKIFKDFDLDDDSPEETANASGDAVNSTAEAVNAAEDAEKEITGI